MFRQRTCDGVVDDAIECALKLAEDVFSSKDESKCQGGSDSEIYVGGGKRFSKLVKIVVAGMQV